MKKFFKFSLISVLIVTTAFAIFKVSNKYRVSLLKDNIDCSVVTKGCDGAKSITVDDNGEIYIGYSDSIKNIDSEGKEKLIYKNKDLNIEDVKYSNNKIYYISKNMIQSFDLQNGEVETISENIPLSGNGIERKLLINKNNMYVSIGSLTNSGIDEGFGFDKSPIDIILNGVNYGEDKTGAFKEKGTESSEGERIKKSEVGNAALYEVDLSNGKLKLYSSGIRGITGIDYNSKGELMAIFSGMENKGVRPVNRDSDYIYKVNNGSWYGWPDFSGGDPIDSPRFKGDDVIKNIIKNHPNKMIEAPIYQAKSVDSLKEMAIDREGTIIPKDSMLFWDRSEETICALNKDGVFYRVLKLNEQSYIDDIIYNLDEFLILDSSLGCIYSLHEQEGLLGFKLPVEVWVFVFLLTFILLIISLLKLRNFKDSNINKM